MSPIRLAKSLSGLDQVVIKRRDIWPSVEDAYSTLKSKPIFQAWDDKILNIYVVCHSVVCTVGSSYAKLIIQQHGLRPLPTLDYPDQHHGVTLKCSKFQEAVRL
jgi:hypothetical protein